MGLGTPLECCSEGDSFWSDLDDPARTPPRAGSHAASQAALPVPAQAMHGASPVPRCLVFRSRLMRHADLGARIFLFGNLFRRPPAGASPSPPPCRLVERLETEAPSEPRSMPCPRP